MNKIKLFFKKLFCKHGYGKYVKVDMFSALNGQRVYIRCEKCGKIKNSYFEEYKF